MNSSMSTFSLIDERDLINEISHLLENFKWERTASGTGNCRCFVCGDSKKNRNKARMFFFQTNDGRYNVYCHNCGYSASLKNFVKTYFKEYFNQYLYADFKNRYQGEPETVSLKSPVQTSIEDMPEWTGLLVPLNSLPVDHAAVQYAKKRHLDQVLDRVFYTDDYAKLAEAINPKYQHTMIDPEVKRIVLICRDKTGYPFGVIGRAIDSSEPLRYQNLVSADWGSSLCYGMDTVNTGQEVVVVEGAVDSLHLPNALAVSTSSLENIMKHFPHEAAEFIYFFDQQPRNSEICKLIETAIDNQKKVVLFPEHLRERYPGKDIDDYRKLLSPKSIMAMIRKFSYSGPTAKLVFSFWKRI